MAKYRKRPLVVEAEQWFPGRMIEGARFQPGHRVDLSKTRGIQVDRPDRWVVDTLEGPVDLAPGDFIITGITGEHYPCKPHIFTLTYERVQLSEIYAAGLKPIQRLRRLFR